MIIKNNQEENPKLMIIPMIDIIFFLLVFFMFSMLSMVHQRSMAIALPKAQSASINSAKTIPISITKEGNIYYEKTEVSLRELAIKLQAEKNSQGELSVTLLGDEGTNYGVIIHVMDAIKAAGISNISVATSSK